MFRGFMVILIFCYTVKRQTYHQDQKTKACRGILVFLSWFF